MDLPTCACLASPRWRWSALVVIIGISGCSSLRGVPQRYQPAAAIVASIQLTPQDLANLQATTDPATRNQLQNKSIAVIDLNYHQFVRDLVGDRQDMATASQGIALGAATAGAFVESVAAKTNYALLAATTIGAFGIIDRNYYYEKTVPALVSAMGAARSVVLLRMRGSQADSIEAYNGVAALADLEDYFTAGTILAAISQIAATSEAQIEKNQADIRALSVPTPKQLASIKAVREAIWDIDDESLDKANKVLEAIGKPVATTAKEARLELIRFNDPTRPDQINRLAKELKANGLM